MNESKPAIITRDELTVVRIPEWAAKLSDLLTAIIMSRCRTKADADRLMLMLREFEEACRLT